MVGQVNMVLRAVRIYSFLPLKYFVVYDVMPFHINAYLHRVSMKSLPFLIFVITFPTLNQFNQIWQKHSWENLKQTDL